MPWDNLKPRAPPLFASSLGPAIRIWLDPNLPSYFELVPLVRIHGAILANDHSSASIIVLHPASTSIFDLYCHPEWLLAGGRPSREQDKKGVGEFGRKVIVTESWPKLCVTAGRMLSVDEDWGGCRKGGPPKSFNLSHPPIPTPRAVAPLSDRELNIHPLTFPATSETREPPPHLAPTRPTPGTSTKPIAPTLPVIRASKRTSTPPPRPLSPASILRLTRTSAAALRRSVVQTPGYANTKTSATRWQGNVAKVPKILRGVRIHLGDLSRYGRKYTISNIKKAQGMISLDAAGATHALWTPVPAKGEQARLEEIRKVAAQGVWCVSYDWLEDSLDMGEVLDKREYVLEGGYPALQASDPTSVTETHGASSDSAAISNATGGSKQDERSTDSSGDRASATSRIHGSSATSSNAIPLQRRNTSPPNESVKRRKLLIEGASWKLIAGASRS